MALLEIDGVTKHYGSVEVISNLSLSVEEHEVICLIGPSGCGKSTLLRCINRLEEISLGEVRIHGDRITGPGVDLDRLRRDIGIVFQGYNLFPHMTVLQNTTLAPLKVLGMKRREAEDRAMAFLERIGLAHKAGDYPDRLSGGQQQRVAIVRALMMDPMLLLLDEITSALDPELVAEVLDIVRDLAAKGLALLDAPVSGGVKRAVDGSLSIMVGGAAADLERARPVFGAMGKTITLCGPAGAGHALKALNNYLSAAGVVAMCEALIVGENFGLDPGTMVDVFNTSTGKSNATEVKGRQFVVPRNFAAGFSMALMAKDLRTAGDVASHHKLHMPNLGQAVAYWTAADGKLGKGADHTEIFRYAEMLAEEN